MIWRNNGAPKCPRCGGRLTHYIEAEKINGVRNSRYVIRCKYCGYRNVLQEVMVKKTPQGVIVSIPKPHRF